MVGNRFISWSKRVWSSCFRQSRQSESIGLPAELAHLLCQKRASALRPHLKSVLASKHPVEELLTCLLREARAAGWSAVELEKLVAYGEFYSGATAAGYQRVATGRLAEADYDLLMTACVHCYLADRFQEGYELLRNFKAEQVDHLDRAEYLAFAGYITFGAGQDVREATGYFDAALDLKAFSPLLAVNAYPIYFEAGMHERLDQLRSLIHQHCPHDPEAIYAMACVELGRDYYAEGFRLAESRYQMPEVGRSINSSLINKPRWQGEAIHGRRLLVHAEQGLGDIVMMARYLPLLQAFEAKIVLDCRSEAIPLLAHNFPYIEMVAGKLSEPVTTPFDLWIGAMSLPYLFGTVAESVPATCGYLSVPPEQTDYWHGRVAELTRPGMPRIGVAWSGNPGHRADKRRSIPFEQMAACIRQHRGLQFFSLQTTVPSVHPANLVNLAEEMLTLADTAALIQEMDLIITVDTSIVHLAGALGKATWLLLPKRYEWRWGLDGENNNWYDSVRVLRQKTHGDWGSVLDDVFGRRLPEFIGSHEARS